MVCFHFKAVEGTENGLKGVIFMLASKARGQPGGNRSEKGGGRETKGRNRGDRREKTGGNR